MYLFEMKSLPSKADKAILEWDKGVKDARRDKNKFAMPYNPLAIYFPLQNGRQFLISHEGNLSFGGTDEEPFLVGMHKNLLNVYINSGGSEDAFYNELVPDNIRVISEDTNIPYKRQGDIFAVKFCGEKYFEKNLARIMKVTVLEKEFNIFATRHIGKGIGLRVDDYKSNGLSIHAFFKGVISAPDHAPLSLDDAFYLLGQTKYIINPARAD